MVIEIKYLVHYLILRGTNVNFCWVPSHCNISANELVDRAAKKGAKNSDKSVKVNSLLLSVQEGYSLLEKGSCTKFLQTIQNKCCKCTKLSFRKHYIGSIPNLPPASNFNVRLITSLFYRFRLDALKTKFCQNVKCICGENLDITHIIFRCQPLRQFLPSSFTDLSLPETKLHDILNNTTLLVDIIKTLLKSPIFPLL